MDTHPSLPQALWEQTPPEVRVYIGTLEARLSALEAMGQALQDQNRALQEQLKQNSRNSSRPPSSDPPQAQRPKRPRSQRRRGGQPGHRGQTRTLLPVEEVNQVVPIKPEQCAGCHAPVVTENLIRYIMSRSAPIVVPPVPVKPPRFCCRLPDSR